METGHPEKWSRAIGNALAAEKKSPSFRLNHHLTDLSTARNAGETGDLKGLIEDNLYQISKPVLQQKGSQSQKNKKAANICGCSDKNGG